MWAVRASGVVKRFDRTQALDGVDVFVGAGEVRGLLGPNGAGKTTLLRILLGLVTPDAGSVELFDQPLRVSTPGALDGVGGFVEDPRFYPYLSGRANLELAAELDGRGGSEAIPGLLERVGLTVRAGDRVAGYSTGMRQRLGIAAALLRSPRLLLLDEPTAGLDPAGVHEVGRLIRELSADGVAILISSHQIVEVEGVCDTFTVLRGGRVVWEGTAAQLRTQAPNSAYRLTTSDDQRALALAAGQADVTAHHRGDGPLELAVQPGALDSYVLALGREGVAVRQLELLASPAESMFFALTEDPVAQSDRSPTPSRSPAPPIRA